MEFTNKAPVWVWAELNKPVKSGIFLYHYQALFLLDCIKLPSTWRIAKQLNAALVAQSFAASFLTMS